MINEIKNKIKDWLGSIIILPVVVYLILSIGKFHFIDYLNLLIHEGGHGIFKIFGGFIYTLGGTLMQLIIPSMFIVYYFVNKKKFLAQIFLVWLGENLINISIYIKDARTKQLPLLGGNKVYHDWNYLLSKINLLEYDQLIGDIVIIFAIISFLIALLVPIFLKNEKPVNLNLDL
ncbi:hypothetical protein [Stygiobacter electus]|uniref:Uncharacterized protein n=1 Tax=Stygiobacter electus TaxID=3032292 RepID=A0AAE3P1L2_9BACT|nr:hypothetical protein [Stygiobacter electus]MDF1612067.1 hypothetical protein [Stygiobacter electus]